MKLKDLVIEYRTAHNMSQRQFAAACDLSNGYVSMLERESNPKTGEKITPKLTALQKLADGMGMTLTQLLSAIEDSPAELGTPYDQPLDSALNRRLTEVIRDLNDDGIAELAEYGRYLLSKGEYTLPRSLRRSLTLAAERVACPVPVRYIRHYLTPAAAGYASPVDGSDYELVAVSASVPEAADFCVSVSGDSMEPYILDGQMVYVQRDATVHDGDVGVFYYNGDVYIKLYCKDILGNVYLLSANPKRQDANIEISHESGAGLVCFGKVLLTRRIPLP